jgi:hypothetical protein
MPPTNRNMTNQWIVPTCISKWGNNATETKVKEDKSGEMATKKVMLI